MTTAVMAEVQSLNATFRKNAGVVYPSKMIELLRLQMTISPEMHREAMRDWFTKIGPPLRLARNWVLNRWKNNYNGFSGPVRI